MVKILRKSQENHEVQFPKFSVFIGQKSIFPHYCIQNVIDRIQAQVCNINNEIVNIFGQFEKVKKISGSISGKVRKIEAQAKLWFLIKITCIYQTAFFHIPVSLLTCTRAISSELPPAETRACSLDYIYM